MVSTLHSGSPNRGCRYDFSGAVCAGPLAALLLKQNPDATFDATSNKKGAPADTGAPLKLVKNQVT